MAHFIYRARDSEGRERQEVREAASEEDLITQLQSEGLLVVSVVREEAQKIKRKAARPFHLRITIDDLVVFCHQLATLLDAGVTLLKSLDILTKQIESKRLLEVTEEVKHDITGGSTFRDALAKHPEVFSDLWVHIVETGEASGALPVTLAQLAEYLETSASIQRKITSALIYPAVLISVAFVALFVFTVWIIPIFSEVFKSFEIQLPVITIVVITFSQLVRKYLFLFLVMAAVLAYMFNRYIHTENGKLQLDRLMLRVPILSSLLQRIAIERFASGLGTLIDSGVPILYGLDIVSKAVGNKVIEGAIVEVRESVREGRSLARPLEKSGVFTPVVVQMVSVGEEIGELGKMLKKVSEFYKERITTMLVKITTLIEPAILLLMGIVIGVLVISMFMPIFQLAVVSRAG